ncbi:MAG: DUF4352 domain-containing protein, partial [Chloroflexota bacterium]|nr:DUF4352 domain-containing protein [Chloroflexota bacterium]
IGPGGEVSGWVALPVSTGETGRQLVFLPGAGDRTSEFRYLAIVVDGALASPLASPMPGSSATPLATPSTGGEAASVRIGLTRDDPAPAGAAVAVRDLHIELLEITRGEGAAIRVREAGVFNPAPLPGNEFAIAWIGVTSASDVQMPIAVASSDFSLIGSANVPYAPAPIIAPKPTLDTWLLPGGSVQGYVAFEVAASDRELTLVYSPAGSPLADHRFFRVVPLDPAATPVP